MKVILTGGGTAGSVTPLLALYQSIKHRLPSSEFLFIGTRQGVPERQLLKGYAIDYASVYSGKLRRYLSWKNIFDVFSLGIGFFQSLATIYKLNPDIIIGAGGYVSVPVIMAGWALQKKVLIHQQDVRLSLTNILTAPCATRITVTFEKSLKQFSRRKVRLTGNPVRQEILHGEPSRAIKKFQLDPALPLVLVTGGGTGARDLNTLIVKSAPELTPLCQIIHLTGPGKGDQQFSVSRYQQIEFITEGMNDLLAAADIVVSRAGLATLTELCALGKASILVPLPNSHQIYNAKYVEERQAAIVLPQKTLSHSLLTDTIKTLIADRQRRKSLSDNIGQLMKHNAAEQITQIIFELLKA